MKEKSFFYRYCVVFPNKFQNICDYFVKNMQENDFDVQIVNEKININESNLLICLGQKSEDRMLKMAETLKLKAIYNSENNKKTTEDSPYLHPKIVKFEKEKRFKFSEKDKFLPKDDYNDLYDINDKKKDEQEKERWGLGLFTEREMLHIEKTILTKIEISSKEEFIQVIESSNIDNNLKKNINLEIDESSLFQTLLNLKVISDSFPINISNFSQKIVKKTLFSWRCPYRLIRSYYNDKIALYFSWTYHYTRFLIIPGIFSLIILVFSSLIPSTRKPLLSLYSIIIPIWVQFFIIFWNRKTSELEVEWSNYEEEFQTEDRNKEFTGEWKISPITEKYELYYSNKNRIINILISLCFLIPILFFAVSVNVTFLNLIGTIREDTYSIFLVKGLRTFARKGRVFEPNSTPNKIIGNMQLIFISVLNQLYGKIAVYTTINENHQTKSNYENSLVIKRFAFSFLDTFFCLYYLAFVVRDLEAASTMIKGILYMNELIRVLTTTIIPNLIKVSKSGNFKRIFSLDIEVDKYIIGKQIDSVDLIKQKNAEVYDTFGDYLELILEFCYLTLFADCIPIAGLLLLIVNAIELRSDIIKIGTIVRRPEFVRKKNIGSWQYIINIVAVLSIFTNLLSNYISHSTDIDYFDNLLGFCIMEHIVFSLIILLRFVWPSTSYWVYLFHKRREYRMRDEQWQGVKNILLGGFLRKIQQ